MPDLAQLLTLQETATHLRMSERTLRRFLDQLGFSKRGRGVKRMFTPADLEYLTEQRSWLSRSASGARSTTREVRSVSARTLSTSANSALEQVLRLTQKPSPPLTKPSSGKSPSKGQQVVPAG